MATTTTTTTTTTTAHRLFLASSSSSSLVQSASSMLRCFAIGKRRAFATAAGRCVQAQAQHPTPVASLHRTAATARVLRRHNTQITAAACLISAFPATQEQLQQQQQQQPQPQHKVAVLPVTTTEEDGRSVTFVGAHRLITIKNHLTDFVTKSLVATVASFRPTWWANAHVQVIFTFLVPQPRVQYARELVPLSDGGQASLDWAQCSVDPYAPFTWLHRVFKSLPVPKLSSQELAPDAPIALVFHGLTGCSHSMQYLCAEALKRGYRPVVFNKRGHGNVPLLTPRFQRMGCIDDLQQALDVIEGRFPQATIYCIGSSAGASLLTSYLGQTGAQARIQAGALISPGYNTYEIFVHDAIRSPYSFLMSLTLKQLMWRNYEQLKHRVDYRRLMFHAQSVSQVERQVCAQVHGELDLEAFWKENEPMHTRHLIRRPLLLLSAMDDPICGAETIEYDIVKSIPQSTLLVTHTGGHCGFYEDTWVRQPFSARACFAYFDSIRQFEQQQQQQAQEPLTQQPEQPQELL